MEPPEQTKPIHHYTLGETGKPEHIANFPTPNDTLLAVANLKPHDPCFVLRSGGNFTFAKIISQQRHQDTIAFIVQVNETGSTKTIPFVQIVEYLRPLRSMVQQPQQWHGMTSSFTNENKNRRATFDAPSLSVRDQFQRRSGFHSSFVSSGQQQQQQQQQQQSPSARRHTHTASLHRNQSDFHMSFTQIHHEQRQHRQQQQSQSSKGSSDFHTSYQSGLLGTKAPIGNSKGHGILKNPFANNRQPTTQIHGPGQQARVREVEAQVQGQALQGKYTRRASFHNAPTTNTLRAYSRRASFHTAAEHAAQQQQQQHMQQVVSSQRSSFTGAIRRNAMARCNSSLRSSIHTSVPSDDDLLAQTTTQTRCRSYGPHRGSSNFESNRTSPNSNDGYELSDCDHTSSSSRLDCNLECNESISVNSQLNSESSSESESPRTPKPQEINLRGRLARKISLPGFDDVAFDEEMLSSFLLI